MYSLSQLYQFLVKNLQKFPWKNIALAFSYIWPCPKKKVTVNEILNNLSISLVPDASFQVPVGSGEDF